MLNTVLNRFRPSEPFPVLAPEEPVCVIGDIHGRFDLMVEALDEIQSKVVFVGDYVDRGDQSADVLRFLQSRDDLVCLMGNHEHMMIKFLQAPEKYGRRWLRFGGLQTLASFGIMNARETLQGQALVDLRDQLAEAMTPGLITWLQSLPSLWRSGNLVVIHAGADPAQPFEAQQDQVFRWGHPDFERTPRSDGIWVAHGHIIVGTPICEQGRINVDTGAYATGRLSMAHIDKDQIRFETVTEAAPPA